MSKIFIFVLLLVCIFAISCERVVPVSENDFETVEIPGIKGIPLEFGSLVAVTAIEPNVSELWFQADDLTIRIVRIDYRTTRILQKVKVIARQ